MFVIELEFQLETAITVEVVEGWVLDAFNSAQDGLQFE